MNSAIEIFCLLLLLLVSVLLGATGHIIFSLILFLMFACRIAKNFMQDL